VALCRVGGNYTCLVDIERCISVWFHRERPPFEELGEQSPTFSGSGGSVTILCLSAVGGLQRPVAVRREVNGPEGKQK